MQGCESSIAKVLSLEYFGMHDPTLNLIVQRRNWHQDKSYQLLLMSF